MFSLEENEKVTFTDDHLECLSKCFKDMLNEFDNTLQNLKKASYNVVDYIAYLHRLASSKSTK